MLGVCFSRLYFRHSAKRFMMRILISLLFKFAQISECGIDCMKIWETSILGIFNEVYGI